MSQVQEQRKELEDFRRELYRDHPEAEAFQRTKSRWLKFMLLYCLVLQALKAVVLGQAGVPLWSLGLSAAMGLGMNAIFLAAGMGPQRKLAWVLYLWGGYNLFHLSQSLWKLAQAWEGGLIQAWGEILHRTPLAALSDLFTLLFVILILLIALWLTAVPRNRVLAAESEPLEALWRKHINAQSANKR